MRAQRVASVIAVGLAAVSCGEARRSPNGPSGAPTPVALVIVASAPSIGVGDSQQLRVSITYSDGTSAPPAGDVTWTTSNEAVYTLWPGGLAVAAGPGAATITASAGGLTGAATLTVEARAGGLRRVQGRLLDLTSGAGMAGATLRFDGPSRAAGTHTDGTGAYAIDLPPGVSTVSVDDLGVGFMVVRVGGPAFRADVYGNVGRCLGRYGLVTDGASYRPIAGATVSYNGVQSVTGIDGWYRLDHSCEGSILGGTATITASHPEYEDNRLLSGRGITGYWRYDFEMRRR